MRSPFQKASAPRIRALTGGPRTKARATPPAPPAAAGTVFREFVATLERIEKSRRRKKPTPPAGGA
ncbi:hypothetical protein [Xanthobacter flavus]|uniref:hypothetical protein n=1 Tax=Xanthobacter flavus TaxID=281 RepID=UPI003726C25B